MIALWVLDQRVLSASRLSENYKFAIPDEVRYPESNRERNTHIQLNSWLGVSDEKMKTTCLVLERVQQKQRITSLANGGGSIAFMSIALQLWDISVNYV